MSGKTVWNRDFGILFFLNTVNNLSFYLMFSALLLYTKKVLAWNPGMIGFFSGFYAIAALLCRPVAGVISDRFGTRIPMLIGNVLMAVSAAFYGLFRSIPALLLTRVLHGAAFSITNTAMTSAVASSLPRDRLSEGIGYYGVAMILAQSVAPGLGLQMAARYSFPVVFYTSSFIAVVCTVCMVLLIPRKVSSAIARKPFRFSELVAVECLGVAAVGATVSGTNGIYSTYLVLSAAECGISQEALSPFYWCNGIALIAARLIIGRISDRKGSYQVLLCSLVLCAASLLLTMRSTTLWMFCFVAIFKGLGTGIGIPSLQAMCYKRVPPERNGVATSTYYIGADVGNGIAPMLAGEAVELSGGGYGAAYLMNLALLGAGALGLLNLRRGDRKKGAENVA